MNSSTLPADCPSTSAYANPAEWMEISEKEWKVFVGRLVESAANGDELFCRLPARLPPAVLSRLWSTMVEHVCVGRVEAVSATAAERQSHKVAVFLGRTAAALADPQLLSGALALIVERIGESALRAAKYDELFQRVAAAVDFGREIRRRHFSPPAIELCEPLFAILSIAERSADSRAYRLLFRFAQFLALLYPSAVPFGGFGVADGEETEIRRLFDDALESGENSEAGGSAATTRADVCGDLTAKLDSVDIAATETGYLATKSENSSDLAATRSQSGDPEASNKDSGDLAARQTEKSQPEANEANLSDWAAMPTISSQPEAQKPDFQNLAAKSANSTPKFAATADSTSKSESTVPNDIAEPTEPDDDDSPLEYDAATLRDACRRRRPTTAAAYAFAFRNPKPESADELVAAFATFPEFASLNRRAVGQHSAQLIAALLSASNRFNLKGFGENVAHCLVHTLRYDLFAFAQFAERLLDSQCSSSRRLLLLKVTNDLIVSLHSEDEYPQPKKPIERKKNREKPIGRILRQSVGLTKPQPKPTAKAAVDLVDLVVRPLIRVATRMEKLDPTTIAGVLSVLNEVMSRQLPGYVRIADEQFALLDRWRSVAKTEWTTEVALQHCHQKLEGIVAKFRTVEGTLDEPSKLNLNLQV